MRSLGSARPTRSSGGGSAFVLAICGRTGGILLREGKGFRFNASDPTVRSLDGVFFHTVADAEVAAETLTTRQFGAESSKAHFSALF